MRGKRKLWPKYSFFCSLGDGLEWGVFQAEGGEIPFLLGVFSAHGSQDREEIGRSPSGKEGRFFPQTLGDSATFPKRKKKKALTEREGKKRKEQSPEGMFRGK